MRLVLLVFAALVCGAMSGFAQSGFLELPLTINIPDQSEILPVISADNKTLYFGRTRMGIDSGLVFDIWRTHIAGDSSYSAPEFVGGNLSSSYGILVTSVSPDNNTLYLAGKLHRDSPPDERLYVAHKLASGWSIPEPIKIPDLQPRALYTDYSFGPDQRTLVMAVDRDSTLGDRDLYVSFFDSRSGNWTPPLWLGPDINSNAAEMTPFLASDNKTLYFSSERPGGIGSLDVYRSVRQDDTWKHWSKPEDLGPGVNRPGRTSYYTEDASGNYAYFSWRPSEHEASAIYRIKVKHTHAIALVHGTVTDANGKPLSAKIEYGSLNDTASSGSARSDPTTGEYQLTLPAGVAYAIRAERDGYFPASDHLDLTALKNFEPFELDLRLNRIETGARVELKNVFFETDRAELLPASFPELDRVVGLLAEHPEFKLEIAGHTDSTGSEAHNLALSKARAEAVAQYLIQKGTASARLTAVGYGSTKPVATNATEAGRAQNRRVEFIVVAK